MNKHTVIRILTDYNKWRRGEIKDIPEDTYTVGQAIDYAIEQLKPTEQLKNTEQLILKPTKKRKLKRIEI